MSDVERVLFDLQIEIVSESVDQRTGELQYRARCPHHFEGTRFDRNPGWYINAENGLHFCQSCSYSGSLARLVADRLGFEWAEANNWLGQRTDILARLREAQPWQSEPREQIVVTPVSRARYLSYDSAIPPEMLAKRQITQKACTEYMVRWDQRQSAWILPIMAEDKTLLGWQVKGEGPDRYFRNLPHGVQKSTTLFGLHTLTGTDEVTLVESPLDAVRLHTLGIPAVSSFGAKVSDTQMRLLIEHSDGIVVALDNDEAGRAGALSLLGLDTKGARKYHGSDYSLLCPLFFYNYGDSTAKDPGDQTKQEIINGVLNSRHSLYGAKAVLQ